MPFGQGPGFIKNNGGQGVDGLQAFPPFDQDAVFGPFAGPDHDGRGGGQTQGAGTGDDHDGHKIQKGEGEPGRRAPEVPDHESEHGNDHHHRHENPGHFIGQALNGGLAALGLLHQADDLGQGRFFTNAGGLEGEAAALVQGGPDDLVPGFFVHRQALPGQHGFIHRRLAFPHPAVHRDLLPRAHAEEVTLPDLLERDIRLLSVADNPGGFGGQTHQFADRFGGLSFGPGLQQTSQQNQGDNHGGAVEIDLGLQSARLKKIREKSGHRGIEVGRQGTYGDQGIHVGAAVSGRPPGPGDELLPGPELHRGGQDKDEDKKELVGNVLQEGIGSGAWRGP